MTDHDPLRPSDDEAEIGRRGVTSIRETLRQARQQATETAGSDDEETPSG
jgi:hypothetical protein